MSVIINGGKAFMLLVWLVLAAACWFSQGSMMAIWLFIIVMLLMMHGIQLLLLTSLPSELKRQGDAWKLLVFGFFHLLSIRRRALLQLKP